ncbi:MAG: LysR family transcriptional regulator [Aliishimia sp.]
MSIDLRHFRCFVAVAEELHFHRAAKKLGVAQPALSRTIKNLENSLGVTLLERSNRRVELTEAGRSFLIGCQESLRHTKRIIEDAHRVQQGNVGTLRIGYTDNAMNGRLPSLLRAFKDQTPDFALLLTHSVTSEQLNQLEDGTIDFGFATGTVSRAGFDFIRIQSERFVCVVYEGHRLALRSSIKLIELADEPMIQGTKEQWQHYYSYLAPLFRNAGFEPKIAQEGLTTSDIQRLVACGIGVALLTEKVVESLPPGLIVLQIEDVDDRLDTIAVWQSNLTNVAKEHFVSFLRKSMHDDTKTVTAQSK